MGKRLNMAGDAPTSLGWPTIMDRVLAARHGGLYVTAAAFAIDVDRVATETEEEPPRPLGWEVFLTEACFVRLLDPHGEHRELVEDFVESVVMRKGDEEQVLGTQVPFAVFDAIYRTVWPKELGVFFTSWKKRPEELLKSLGALFADEEANVRLFAQTCLEVPMEPPLAPTTREILEMLVDEDI